MIDREEVIRALKLWFHPGDVFEVRILEAVTGDYLKPHVETGYFDFEHIGHVADALAKLRSYCGVYATVNPVNPDLLGRANNRLRPAGRNATTTDADIVCRRWLLIDCDAVRPSGISSTDAEHDAALAKAKEIRDGMGMLGWPEPVMSDSGNGAQLMYRIEQPARDGELVQRIIAEIAKASDEHVHIDLTVHNPSRIWRIPGTMNCKGDSIPSRPHRMAKILSAPEKIVAVTDEQLRVLAGTTPQVKYPEIPDSSKFDIDAWIANHCPDLGAPQPWQGGRKWVFPVCPFNEAHTNRSAVLIQQASGAIAFRCHHNGCSGNDWRKLRELKEPGCYERSIQSEQDSEVNLGNILAQKTKGEIEIAVPSETEIIMPWRKISNRDVLNALNGTYLGELAGLFADVTNPPLPIEGALMKAIVTCGCCLSGEAKPDDLRQRFQGNLANSFLMGADRARLKINTAGGQVCNVYGMIVANSASGKDIGNLIGKFSRLPNPCVIASDGIVADWDIGTSGSAEGLALALTRKPNGLVTISEMANWLDPHHWQNKATSFLTEAFGQGYYNQIFSDRGRGAASRRVDYCAPNIIANIQPNVFERLVRMQDIDTGFLGRFIIAKMPEFYGDPKNFDSAKIMADIHAIATVFLRKQGIVELEDGYSQELKKVFLGRCDPKLNPSWRRLVNEYYPRFMVMLSVTGDIRTQGSTVVISEEARNRARVLVLWFFASAEKMLLGIDDVDERSREFEKLLRKVFVKIRSLDRGQGVTIKDISNGGVRGTNGKTRREAISELAERGLITCDNSRYSIAVTPPEWL